MSKVTHIGTIHKTQVYHNGKDFQATFSYREHKDGRKGYVPVIRYNDPSAATIERKIPDSTPPTSNRTFSNKRNLII